MSSNEQQLSLLGNFFQFQVKSSQHQIQKYSIHFAPDIPDSQSRIREQILRKAQPSILASIGRWVFANTALFSINNTSSLSPLTLSSLFDNTTYQITLTPVGQVDSPLETRAFYNKFFNSIQGKLNLVMIGRKFFNPNRQIDLHNAKLCIWPGYSSAVSNLAGGCYINIDISHRCLRTQSVYQQLEQIQKRSQQDYRAAFQKLVLGAVVLTTYNKKCYHVDEVAWDHSPDESFSDKSGNACSYSEYYSTRWKQSIKHRDQPLLLSKKKDLNLYLIPELCVLTGLSDEIRSDFNIMRDMAQVTKKEPHERLLECKALVEALYANPRTAEEIGQWKTEISLEPTTLTGRKLDAGRILMGKNNQFVINDRGSFDRETQTAMFTQPEIKKWAILFFEKDRQVVERMMEELKKVLQTYQVVADAPALFPIRSDRWGDWDAKLKSFLNPGVQFILCILPGFRGKSNLYDDLKRLTFETLPVPSQVVLTGTLKKEKGLRSVLNKVIVQINAKMGGVPWALERPPLIDVPTMIVGIDVFHKRNSHSVLGVCATVDRHFSNYVSIPVISDAKEQAINRLSETLSQALEEFRKANQFYPARVIVFRDGVSDLRTVQMTEVPMLMSALETLGAQKPKLLFLLVNKRTNARFYSAGGRAANPPLGTVVDSVVNGEDGNDFYVMPARANQGAMTPTHFHVVHDDTGVSRVDVQRLSYRLCYSYYNWSGSIRVPAPCQYAHKLAYTIGERSKGPPVPHQHWKTTRSLYFL